MILSTVNSAHKTMPVTDVDRPRFVISSLPRCGSTSLAELLSAHKNIKCLVEPFHPKRYRGRYHELARNERALDSTLRLIWNNWNGIKHVWQPNGWPFLDRAHLNDSILLNSDRVILLTRQNLLRRFISNYISQNTDYWIGTRSEFQVRLDRTRMPRLDPRRTREQINEDRDAQQRILRFLQSSQVPFLNLHYEQLFRTDATSAERLGMTNSILRFLGYDLIQLETFTADYASFYDATLRQWGTTEVYSRIPNIEEIERDCGSDETGWLFRSNV